jgi:hypothetical protein
VPTRYEIGGSDCRISASLLVGRNAAIHHPDALGLAILVFDFLQEAAQRRVVGGIAGQDFIRQRKALGRHDQGDHHLHAITALVAAVAVTALVVLVIRRVRFEIGAGQVVEQNLEAGAKQILPALPQVAEQCGLVRQHLVQAAIQRVLRYQRIILAEKIPHRALLEPLPM